MKLTVCLGLLFATFLVTSVAKPANQEKQSLKQKIRNFIEKPKLHNGLEKPKKTGSSLSSSWWIPDSSWWIPDSSWWITSSWWNLDSSWWNLDSSYWTTDSSWWIPDDSSWWTTGSSWWNLDSSWWNLDSSWWIPDSSSWWTTGSSWWNFPSSSEFSVIAGPSFESDSPESFGEGEACIWGEWSVWSDCSTDCGAGIRTRVRPCSCEIGCVGDSSEEEMCFKQTCDECNWGEWSPWSECNIDCGAGTRSRDRPCPCDNCEGEESEIEACHKLTCNPEASKGCGTRKVIEEKMTRIVGGTTAAVGALPWQAMLFDGSSFTCGGTLIGRKYVLSAAHCFTGSNSPQSWKVNLGKQHREWNADPADGEFSARVRKIITHPHYDDNTLDNDIALMVLDTDVPTNSDKINIACLDQTGERDVNGKSNCLISGWGTTSEGGNVADELQEAEVPIVDRDACIEAYDGDITDNMLCAGYLTGGIDSCQGDSGGPLVCPYSDDNDGEERWYLVGVTSWGYGCAAVGYPGVYTNVANYLEWIKEKMAENQ